MINRLRILTRFSLPALFMILLGSSCSSNDSYYYPSVKQEFVTAQSAPDGSLKSILTDGGQNLEVVEDASNTHINADSFVRIVCNYASMDASGEASSGIKLYNLLKAIAPLPQPVGYFKNGGVKNDPADVLSIWMGLDYLNIILKIKAQNGKHLFSFVEDQVVTASDAGERMIYLSLYHDAGGDVQAYTKRAYLSVPLRQYATEGIAKIIVHFSLYTYADGMKTFQFEYNPK